MTFFENVIVVSALAFSLGVGNALAQWVIKSWIDRGLRKKLNARPAPSSEPSKLTTELADLGFVWERCALTCEGGSERKGCPCASPADCIMKTHPDFEEHRHAESRRMLVELRRKT